jgi:hypothetical protein
MQNKITRLLWHLHVVMQYHTTQPIVVAEPGDPGCGNG